ncbi:5'-nucleotidase C-terminal domain-containing protein [Polaribacter gochangensis]|uniref:5'-nucleotidase C-terminal domain-containing protein n=1 Tax=Polaribacter gochangensis TaxID=3252903 RepID=UPI0039046F8E
MRRTLKRIAFLFFLSFLIFSCKNEKYAVTKITANTISIDSSLASDTNITKTIAPFKEKMIKEINTIISYTPKDIVRTDGDLESSLGNLMADLSYERANPIFYNETGKNIDFAMFNYGGIRAGIPEGNITNKHAFELMPFDNMFVVVELTGNKMEALINYLITNKTAHPLSKHIQLSITKNGYRLFIQGKKFDKKKNYYVLTTDYLQGGGDKMVFFKNPKNSYKQDYKMRDAIVDYFKSVDTIKTVLDNRFKR